jgi:arylsulfatase A-like enzyme
VAHGQTLYRESLHVPLLVRLPGGRSGGRRIDTLAQHADILPTILDVTGVAAPAGLAGSSLVRARPASVEAHASLALGPFALDALIGDRWKVVRDRSAPPEDRVAVYATDRDPGERVDRAADSPVLIGYARTRLHELAAPGPAGPPVPPERLERLRALGYVTE